MRFKLYIIKRLINNILHYNKYKNFSYSKKILYDGYNISYIEIECPHIYDRFDNMNIFILKFNTTYDIFINYYKEYLNHNNKYCIKSYIINDVINKIKTIKRSKYYNDNNKYKYKEFKRMFIDYILCNYSESIYIGGSLQSFDF